MCVCPLVVDLDIPTGKDGHTHSSSNFFLLHIRDILIKVLYTFLQRSDPSSPG